MMTSSDIERQYLIIEILRKNEEIAFEDGQVERALMRKDVMAWWMENLGGVKLRAIKPRQDVRWSSVSGEIDDR